MSNNNLTGTLNNMNHLNGELGNKKAINGVVTAKNNMSGSLQVAMLKGKSAYEIAVANGFIGTEEEWLASLKGEKGDKGDQGERGEQGVQGERGETGEATTIEIGSVTTGVPTSVVNSGDEHHAVLDFVLPNGSIATEEVAGVMKLYDVTGENMDGSMTQRAVTHAIDDSAEPISAEDLIAILV